MVLRSAEVPLRTPVRCPIRNPRGDDKHWGRESKIHTGPGGEWSGREAHHYHPSSAEVMNEWSYFSPCIASWRAHGQNEV